MYPFVTGLHLLRNMLRSVVAPIPVVQRLIVVITQRAIRTVSIAQILKIIIGSAVQLELSRIVDGAV